MGKSKLIYIVFALWIVTFYSCYDDKSTFATDNIGEVVIDVSGTSPNIYVGYQEELSLTPTISVGNNSNVDYLDYKWYLSRTSGNANPDYELLSTEKELHAIISRPIDIEYYVLKLTVTDTENNNLQYENRWYIHVQSSFIDGLLIADSKDGVSSDLSLILNRTFTTNYNKDETIYRTILTNANGEAYNGLISSLTYEVLGYPEMSSHTNQVWAVTEDGDACRFDCQDFSITGNTRDESIITYKPGNLEFKSFFCASQMLFANTTTGFYNLMRTSTNSFGWYDAIASISKPNNNIIASNSSRNISYNHTIWYDKEQARFVSYTGIPAFGSAQLSYYQANSQFDPNALTGKSAIAGIISEDEKIGTFLLKDDATGQYTIYTLNQYKEQEGYWNDDWTEYTETSPEVPASAGNRYYIPNEGKTLLDNAISVFFFQNSYVLYVATESGIYAITYGAGNNAVVQTAPKYTAAGGEKITKAKLYQQGHFTNDMYMTYGSEPYVQSLPWHNKALIVTTQSANSEGKVYVIPITQTGIGTLDPSQALSYAGFGKILDVITIGY